MRPNQTHLTLSGALLCGLAATGCDPMSHEKYRGEVLASIHGLAAVKDPGFEPPPTEVVLLWAQDDRAEFNMVAERVPVTGKFPAEFKMDLHQPPPAAAGFTSRGARLNLAVIGAFKQGVLKTGDSLIDLDAANPAAPFEAWLGLANELVIHLDKDVPDDHPISIMTGGINKKGFHLVHEVPTPLAERERRAAACKQVFTLSPEDCEPDPKSDKDVAAVPGGFEGHRIRIEVGKAIFPMPPG